MSTTASKSSRRLLYTVYLIYFLCGMALCFEGAFNPEFKDYFRLSYQQQQYTTFAKNIPFTLAIGIGFLIPKIGYKNCLTLAMGLFASGTLLLIPGLQHAHYGLVLAAFFLIGLGFNFELVAGNPLLTSLGPPEDGSSRLNLGNALGAIAQIIAPLVLSLIIPISAVGVPDKMPYMKGLFLVIAIFLIALFVLTLVTHAPLTSLNFEASTPSSTPASASLWRHPRVVFGFLTIFLVLGAEAGLFGFFRNYVEDPTVAGVSSHSSQQLFTLCFATFALSRLLGSWVQKRIRPERTLLFNGVGALAVLGVLLTAHSRLAIAAMLLLGFFVSTFFPTLYALAIKGLGDQTAKASGLLTMGFLGCAVLPVLQGKLADTIGLQRAFCVCLLPYLAVVFYALKCKRADVVDPATKVNPPKLASTLDLES